MNRIMKYSLLLLLLCTAGSFAEPKGWGVGIGTFDGDIGMQGRKTFLFGEVQNIGLALQAGVYNQNKWTGRFDADVHYYFMPDKAVRLYPLAGLDFALQSSYNRFGANVGGGAILDLNDMTQLYIEAKYVAGDWDGFGLTFGIYF